MIDIHTHILYNIDDGAKTIEDSMDLIQMEIEDEVNNIVLTPHFDPYCDSIDRFIEIYADRYNNLLYNIENKNINITLYRGSEVYYSDALLYYSSLKPLCISNTKYMLIEFSETQKFSGKFMKDFTKLIEKFDIVPIIAHIEKYNNIKKNYRIINKLRELGCIIQVNADNIIKYHHQRFYKNILTHELADIIASDCHDTLKRPPKLLRGMNVIKNYYGMGYYEKIISNQNKIINIAKEG